MIRLPERKVVRLPAIAWLPILLLAAAGCSPRIHVDFLGESNLREITLRESEAMEKVLVVDLTGMIRSDDDGGIFSREGNIISRVVSRLQKAEKDPLVRGVILRIDSPGGEVTASDVMYNEILRFKERRKVPVVVSMLGVAASGGYYIACAADHIYAHPTTITGSIGVISVFPNARDLLDKVGVGVTVVKSGKMKDAGSTFRPMGEEEKAYFQEIIDGMYHRFLEVVSENRGLSMDDLSSLADGRVFTAGQARDAGLIDGIAYFDEVLIHTLKLSGLEKARVVVYSYRPSRKTDLYARAEGDPFPARTNRLVNALVMPLAAGFYYLWSPDLASRQKP